MTTSHFDVCFSVAYLTRISPGFAAELTADDSLAILNPLISVVLATHSCPRSLTQYRIQGVGISRSLEEGFTALNATTTKKHWRAWRTLKGGGSRTLHSLTYKKCMTSLFSMRLVLRSRRLQPQLLWLSRSSLGGTTWKRLELTSQTSSTGKRKAEMRQRPKLS